MLKRYSISIFLFVWIISLLFSALSIVKLTPLNSVVGETINYNFFQRLFGLIAFTMLFYQIVFGMFLKRLIEKYGGWVFKFHLTQGALIYSLVILHPLLFLLFRFNITKSLDPFYIFTDFCVLCETRIDLFYTFGRLAFWLMSVAFLAALFRDHPSLRSNWKRYHNLNYLVFFLVAYHAWGVGTDVQQPGYVWFFLFQVFVIFLLLLFKKLVPFGLKSLSKLKIK